MENSRILVVDDEQNVLDLLQDVLAGEGYQVDTALDARGALEHIHNKIYDAAVLDFNLPDMNGVMLHRQIRQLDAELAQKTIFMSGLVQDGSNMDYYTAFGGGFVAKPFDVSQIIDAIRTVLNSREG